MNRARFILIIALLIVLSVFGASGYWVVGRAKAEAETFESVTLKRLALGGEINAYQAEGYARVLLLLNTDDPQERLALHAAIEEYRGKNDTALRAYADVVKKEDSKRYLSNLEDKREKYREIRERVTALSDQGQKDEALRVAKVSLWPAYREYTLAGDVMLDGDTAEALSHAAHIRRVCELCQLLAALVAAFGFIGGISLPLMLVWLGKGLGNEVPLHP